MAIDLQPKRIDSTLTDGVSSSDDAVQRYFFAYTDDDETDADVHAFLTNPANLSRSFLGLGLSKFSIVRLDEDDSIWDVTAHYESRSASWTLPKLSGGEFRWRIRTAGGGSYKATRSAALVSEAVTAAQYEYAGTLNETAMGIRKNSKGGYEIEGVDTKTSSIYVDIDAVWTAAQIAAGHHQTVAGYAAQYAVNSNPWQGWAAGTLQIDGYSASPRSAETGQTPDWDARLTLKFEPNLAGLMIGTLGPINKQGHEYLDVLYGRGKLGTMTVSTPRRAAVHRRWPLINFGTALALA